MAGIARWVAAASVAWLLSTAPAWSANRGVALVVGNNDYRNTPDLQNAGKDARDMAAALRESGFEVIEAYDADLVAFNGALTRFGRAIDPGEPAVVFYAGHGVQGISPAGGIDSYLVPVDAEFPTPERIAAEAVSLNEVLAKLEQSGAGPRLVILDACRENVFGRKWQSGARGLARLSGLASPSAETLRGVFIAYATSPGDVAKDGKPGGNGLFTGAVLKRLRTPGQTVNTLFSEVSADVETATGGDQQPWFSGSGTAGRLILRPGTAATAPVVAAPAAADPAQIFLAENKTSPGGMTRIAKSYRTGADGLKKNEAEALRWLRLAAASGDADGALELGRAYRDGRLGLARDDAQAARWLEQAAKGGNTDAMTFLGAANIAGWSGRPADLAEGRRWIELAAQAGDPKAMNSMAYFLELGQGGAIDRAGARRWYARAAEKGDAYARERLAELEKLGDLAADSTGPVVLTPAAQAKLRQLERTPTGMMAIADRFYGGVDGFPRHMGEATRWMQKAADAGDLTATYGLASAYFTGAMGLPHDTARGAELLKRGAQAGHPASMSAVGMMHTRGMGGFAPDPAEGRKWLEKAAKAGDAEAIEFLKKLDADRDS